MRRESVVVRSGLARFGCACGLVAVFIGSAPAFAAETTEAPASSIVEALKAGTPSLFLRYRLESVADDAPAVADKDAVASTLRTTLGYRSAAFRGVRGAVEFENVTVVGDDAYANGGAGGLSNGITDRPVVADPKITAVTRAYAELTSIPRLTLRAGRDELSYDNQRFIGPVGFRQHHQSVDAVSLRGTAIENVKVAYDFAWQVNRIFGDSKPMASHFANVQHRPGPTGVTLFYYHLDFDRDADEPASRASMGVRIDGRPKLGDWTVLYDLSYAEQAEVGDNPAEVDATYWHAELGATATAGTTPVTGRAGYERLGGSPAEGQFQTPLATLHAFNGWADKFLVTPADGLVDTYVSLGAKPGTWALEATWHQFTADEGDADYGTELNLEATWKAEWGQVFGATAAFYDADTIAFDTRKLWLWTQLAVR